MCARAPYARRGKAFGGYCSPVGRPGVYYGAVGRTARGTVRYRRRGGAGVTAET